MFSMSRLQRVPAVHSTHGFTGAGHRSPEEVVAGNRISRDGLLRIAVGARGCQGKAGFPHAAVFVATHGRQASALYCYGAMGESAAGYRDLCYLVDGVCRTHSRRHISVGRAWRRIRQATVYRPYNAAFVLVCRLAQA